MLGLFAKDSGGLPRSEKSAGAPIEASYLDCGRRRIIEEPAKAKSRSSKPLVTCAHSFYRRRIQRPVVRARTASPSSRRHRVFPPRIDGPVTPDGSFFSLGMEASRWAAL